MMIIMLIVLVLALSCFVVALELITRRQQLVSDATPGVDRDDISDVEGPTDAHDEACDRPEVGLEDLNLRYAFGYHDSDAQRAPVATVLEPSDLLDVEGLPGAESIERILHDLVGDLVRKREWPQRQPHRPTAVLLYGPPGDAMNALVHVIARRLHARLVHLFASQVLSEYTSGSQPLIASAVYPAKRHLPSVLFLDELETLVEKGPRDVRRQRAVHDLLSGTVQPTYGPTAVVIATLATSGPPPRWLADWFCHIVRVQVPDFERTMRRRPSAWVAPVRLGRDGSRRPLRRHHPTRRAA